MENNHIQECNNVRNRFKRFIELEERLKAIEEKLIDHIDHKEFIDKIKENNHDNTKSQ